VRPATGRGERNASITASPQSPHDREHNLAVRRAGHGGHRMRARIGHWQSFPGSGAAGPFRDEQSLDESPGWSGRARHAPGRPSAEATRCAAPASVRQLTLGSAVYERALAAIPLEPAYARGRSGERHLRAPRTGFHRRRIGTLLPQQPSGR